MENQGGGIFWGGWYPNAHYGYLANCWLLEVVSWLEVVVKYEHIGTLHRKLFYGGGMDKNVDHHGWLMVKKFKITLAKRL